MNRLLQPITVLMIIFFLYSTLQTLNRPSRQRDFQASTSQASAVSTTSTTSTSTSTTSKSTTTAKTRPKQPINSTLLGQLVDRAKPVPGKYKDSVVFGLKDMLGGADLPVTNDVYNQNILIMPSDDQECSPVAKEKLLVVALCFVGADRFDRRQLIRNTWAATTNQDTYNFKTVFIIGRTEHEALNQRIKNESVVHNDILQLDYIDTYHTLTNKLIGSLKWANVHCSNAQFILRINDDIVPHRNNLISYLKSKRDEIGSDNLTNIIIGYLWKINTMTRDPSHKFYVSVEEYSGDKYLPYMDGSAYIVTQDVAHNIHELAKKVYWPPFSVWLEDIYVGWV